MRVGRHFVAMVLGIPVRQGDVGQRNRGDADGAGGQVVEVVRIAGGVITLEGVRIFVGGEGPQLGHHRLGFFVGEPGLPVATLEPIDLLVVAEGAQEVP